jgi:hypothetical protein
MYIGVDKKSPSVSKRTIFLRRSVFGRFSVVFGQIWIRNFVLRNNCFLQRVVINVEIYVVSLVWFSEHVFEHLFSMENLTRPSSGSRAKKNLPSQALLLFLA